MSSAPVSVRHLKKRFRRGERHDSLRDLLPSIAGKIFRRNGAAAPELGANDFWAVNDVSFEVQQGEALGIIGPNGAGKSTMLKLLTRILPPTSGRCEVNGRIGALIELAAGFHPDLTGRENVYLQGAIMGMRRREIATVLDGIIDFAGVEAFIDTPVKRFSSGMNARLGFSIAAHLNPEVMIIDEVLAVGDLKFQEKCIERMRQFKRDGAAIVFVSHNMQAISVLCDRAIYLNASVQSEGTPSDVIGDYLRISGSQAAHTGELVQITQARLRGPDDVPVSTIGPGTQLHLDVDMVAQQSWATLVFGFLLHRSTDGLRVYEGNVSAIELGVDKVEPGTTFTLHHSFRAHVTRGQYHVEIHVFDKDSGEVRARLSPAGVFTVFETRTYQGVADLELQCSA